MICAVLICFCLFVSASSVSGGGRILRDDESKRIHIFGYSYGFGQADHQLAKDVVQQSASYREYNVTW